MQNFIDAYSWINIRFLLQGLGITIEISVASIICSFIIGTLLGIIRYAKIKYLSAIVGFIIDLIRNLPLLLIIFFTYFGLPNIGVKPEIIPAAIMALTVFESSMVAEIVRSGINSIDYGQTEGALANGLTKWQALRLVVLPQAIKNMLPALVSQFISLVKDTSLATIIVLPELMYHAQIIYGQNTNYIIPMFVALAVLYFIVCYSLSLLARYLDKHLA
ncbi:MULTISPECIES: amino acid ABC transporter permease [Limosilactobacillus]|jgi:putative glutamine transport system permease protein|uniref:Amino acid ABC transporter permease n=1 Tax=Limosilactobacillus portuensis TaxID=2742601 RepID=A0ABS6ITA1_9LACO|nr:MULTISPECIES: amino acid ABC transporter permease [Limosilactobacillus]MDU1504905.1 amino acid ABC transporter permease [Limosilactobacillus vaginalis]PMC28187.1 glutamine ABC transporter permease [Gardnerella vaginalis]MBD8086546.1 amino acid ABC transporter permease [Limosilactobacillus portuensis]MBU9694753.1 amino acid ABC transporter permease [Limosilactobacillus portuensis]MEC4741131.1 amino acid ABC transporter permease [Limosilactobacillus sp. c10Ua_36]